MKNTIFLAITAFFATASLQAQEPANIDSARRGTTVDSIRAKYKLQAMPEAWTMEKAFPALGTYQLNNPEENPSNLGATPSTLTVTMDSASKGVVWIEGLPQGRIKAFLKKSPSTYRIIPQKTESGTQVEEGTLVYDTTTKQLNVAIGVPFNDADPTSVFSAMNNANTSGEPAEVKIKTKDTKIKAKAAKFYTATKQLPQMQHDMNATDSMQTQDTQQTQPLQPQQPEQPQQPNQPQQP